MVETKSVMSVAEACAWPEDVLLEFVRALDFDVWREAAFGNVLAADFDDFGTEEEALGLAVLLKVFFDDARVKTRVHDVDWLANN